jgi:predicted PurR-regulated permease PerM
MADTPHEQASGPPPPAGPSASVIEERPLRLPPLKWIFQASLVVIAALLLRDSFVIVLRYVSHLLTWIVIALFASFALEPAVGWLARRGWRRGLATGVLLFGLAIVAMVMVGLMIPLLVRQVQELINAAPGILQSISETADRWFHVKISAAELQGQLGGANSAVSTFATNIAGHLFGFATSIIGTIFKLLTIGLFTFYLTADGPRFRRALCSFLPKEAQRTVLWTWEVAIEKTGAYLYSRLLLAIFSGIATFITLTILGVPYAVPLAAWMGIVSQFIPTIGTYIAMALPLLVGAVEGGGLTFAILLAFFTAYQQVENYLLSPRITARTMHLHPALAFGFAIAGASISGVVGAFLALPTAAIIQAVGSTFIHRHEVTETELTRIVGPEESQRIREERRARSWSMARLLRRNRDRTDGDD